MAKALFERIFDGPDSVFGRIFGPSEPEQQTVRITLTTEHLKKLCARETLSFVTEDARIEVKYSE